MSDHSTQGGSPLKKALKSLTPNFLQTFAKRAFAAVGTPFAFSFRMGHLRSSIIGKAVDRQGKAVPWFTYGMIDFLKSKDLSGRSVMEFGSGHSTIWWGTHAREVVAFEFHEGWHRYMLTTVSARVTLHFEPTVPQALAHVTDRKFDIIVIDGYDRVEVSRSVLDYLAPGGAIILDDAEGVWGPPIVRYFREQGLQRVDFYGFGPALSKRRCTSLFFRGECCLLRGEEEVAIPA